MKSLETRLKEALVRRRKAEAALRRANKSISKLSLERLGLREGDKIRFSSHGTTREIIVEEFVEGFSFTPDAIYGRPPDGWSVVQPISVNVSGDWIKVSS